MLAMMLLIVGCKKENQDKQTQFSNKSRLTLMQENVLHFDSFDEVYDYLNADQQDGFMSYGEIMDQAYFELDPEKRFKTLEELKAFVEANCDRYQLILVGEDEFMFESRLYNHPFRNVANQEGLFQVKDSTYRIVENGLLATPTENAKELSVWDPMGICSNKVVYHSFVSNSKDNSNNCGSSLEDEHVDGFNKIVFSITITNGSLGGSYSFLNLRYYAKPYHYSVAWFGCYRTITLSTHTACDYYANNTWKRHDNTYSYETPSTVSSLEKNIKFFTNSIIQDVHIGGTDSYARTADAGKVHFKCNVGILNMQ